MFIGLRVTLIFGWNTLDHARGGIIIKLGFGIVKLWSSMIWKARVLGLICKARVLGLTCKARVWSMIGKLGFDQW